MSITNEDWIEYRNNATKYLNKIHNMLLARLFNMLLINKWD